MQTLCPALVCLPQLANLSFQRLYFVRNIGCDARPLAAVDLSLLHTLIQGWRRAVDLFADQ